MTNLQAACSTTRSFALALAHAAGVNSLIFWETFPLLARFWIVSCTTPKPLPVPGAVTGSKTTPPLPVKRTKTRRANPSPTNLQPRNRRAEWLAFWFCSFYFASQTVPMGLMVAIPPLQSRVTAIVKKELERWRFHVSVAKQYVQTSLVPG